MPELTFGQKAAGVSFNPSGKMEVDNIKQAAATFIDMVDEIRKATSDPDVIRMASVAITEAQTAQMWAVKAATWTPGEPTDAGKSAEEMSEESQERKENTDA